MPQVVSSPHVATMPGVGRAGRRVARRIAVRIRVGEPPGGVHGPAPSGSSAPSGSPASSNPVTTKSASCTNPSYSTSAADGMLNASPYFVSNNMWNASGYSVSQTLYACSYSNWYVTATMNNDNGDGAVKTYPNSQRDFTDTISSLSSVTSTFAETSPGTGIYKDAYDIWLNGLATSGSTELMIWTQNNGQTPSGSDRGRHARRADLHGVEERQLHRVCRQIELHRGNQEPAGASSTSSGRAGYRPTPP